MTRGGEGGKENHCLVKNFEQTYYTGFLPIEPTFIGRNASRPPARICSQELHSTIWTSTQNIFLPGISLNNVIGGSFRSGPTHETATPLGRSPKKHSLAGKGERVRRPSLHSLSSPLAAREAGAEGGKKEGWVSARYACVREKESYTSSIGKRKEKSFCVSSWMSDPAMWNIGNGRGRRKRGGGYSSSLFC